MLIRLKMFSFSLSLAEINKKKQDQAVWLVCFEAATEVLVEFPPVASINQCRASKQTSTFTCTAKSSYG